MAPSPTPSSFLSFFSGAFFLGLFRLARFCPLFVYDPGSYLFFPSFVSPLFLKLCSIFLYWRSRLGLAPRGITNTSGFWIAGN
jgi:hypothetical protein